MVTAGGVAVFTTGCSEAPDRAPYIEAAASFLSALSLFVSWQLHHIRAPQQPFYVHLKAVRDLRQPVDVGLRKQGQRGAGYRGRCWRKAGQVSCCGMLEPFAEQAEIGARDGEVRKRRGGCKRGARWRCRLPHHGAN